MKIKYAFLFTLALLAGCNNEEKSASTEVKLPDGSEIVLSGIFINSSKKPNAEGTLNINKLQYTESIEIVQAELESKLKSLGYTPYSLPSSEGVKFNYTKYSAPTIGVFLKSASVNGKNLSFASIYWHESKI
ncbi:MULTISPECIES: hypothetical protein [unclassified Pseudomonas]|uniref:hypothetical protein n=1 Tax=unclassified Pseudomonas TaxID=196821 RepID=UPI001179D2EB|nr:MULTISPECIES: hypothetical protein [unclassified Pseudomonas]